MNEFLSSDSDMLQEDQADSHGDEISRTRQGEAGLRASADTGIEAVQSEGGSAGPEGEEDSSSEDKTVISRGRR